MRVLITGGAGFVGSQLAKRFAREWTHAEVCVLDNLRRRGSELNLSSLKDQNIEFFHGDIRCPQDLTDLPGEFDLLIEASAEPSVLSGVGANPNYVLQTNLVGTLNCLEFARQRVEKLIFLSTSRVYSIDGLRSIRLEENGSRFQLALESLPAGVSERGISEQFNTQGPRSFYGASKLASEQIIQEYVYAYGMKAVLNRCGVIAGEGQFGKVDQGVVTYWVARHRFSKPLCYTGFGGKGQQIRDVLHPDDLGDLLIAQAGSDSGFSGEVFNVGGGVQGAISLAELTNLCHDVTGVKLAIGSNPKTHLMDVPYFVTDNSKVEESFGWRAHKTPREIVSRIDQWIVDNKESLRPILG